MWSNPPPGSRRGPQFKVGGEGKAKIGLMAVSMTMMCYITPTAALADLARAFPRADPAAVQMIISAPSLLSIAVSLVAGRLTRWIHKRHLLLVALLLFIASGPLPFYVSGSLEVVLLSAAVVGVGLGIMVTCSIGLICDCFEGGARTFLLELQAAFISAGGTAFNLLGGWLGGRSWQQCFLAYYLIVPVFLVAFLTLPKGRLEKPTDRQPAEKPAGWLTVPILYYALATFFFHACILVFSGNIAMLVAARGLGGARESGMVAMLFTLIGIPVGCTVHLSIKRLGRRVIPITSFVASAGMLLCFLGGGLWPLWLGAALCGAGMQQFVPTGSLFAADASRPENRSLGIAIFQSAGNMGAALSPLILSALVPGTDASPRFWAAAVGFALLGMATALVRPGTD